MEAGGELSFGLAHYATSEFELLAEELLMSDSVIKVSVIQAFTSGFVSEELICSMKCLGILCSCSKLKLPRILVLKHYLFLLTFIQKTSVITF